MCACGLVGHMPVVLRLCVQPEQAENTGLLFAHIVVGIIALFLVWWLVRVYVL